MFTYFEALNKVRGQKSMGDMLEVIAILANSQRITQTVEENLQDWVSSYWG